MFSVYLTTAGLCKEACRSCRTGLQIKRSFWSGKWHSQLSSDTLCLVSWSRNQTSKSHYHPRTPAELAAPGTLGQHDRSDIQAAALELPHACIRGWSPGRRRSGSGFAFVSDHHFLRNFSNNLRAQLQHHKTLASEQEFLHVSACFCAQMVESGTFLFKSVEYSM